MPVTWRSSAVMPSVANGARRQAWNASFAPPSGMGRLAREAADAREQLGRHVQAFARRLLLVARAALARQAHLGILGHHGDECLHALQVHLLAGERAGIDREEGLAD